MRHTHENRPPEVIYNIRDQEPRIYINKEIFKQKLTNLGLEQIDEQLFICCQISQRLQNFTEVKQIFLSLRSYAGTFAIFCKV